MKDIVLVLTLLLAVGLSVVVVRFAQKADKASRSLDEERYSRMVAEETLQKNDAKMATFQEALKEDQNKMNKITAILDQEKTVNSDLKKQYDDLTQAKSNLESKLQSVLQEKAAALAALQAQVPAPAAQPAAAAPTAQAAVSTAGSSH
jgi:chromosome segregation ATPase